MLEGSGCGKAFLLRPRVPGLFLMVMRAGAERPRGCSALPPPARDHGVHGLRPPGEIPWSTQSLRPLQ